MKSILTLLAIIVLSIELVGQVPQKMTYQAVIRDSQDQLLREEAVGLKISILQGSFDGPVVYEETQNPQTNNNGLISIEIGNQPEFLQINWSEGVFFLKTEIDPTGGTDYSIMGVSQLLSVPFALHAGISNKAEKLFDGKVPGEMLYWSGKEWVAILPGEHDQVLRFCDGVPTWGPCPEIIRYLLTLVAEPEDSGVLSGEGEYREGEVVPVSAVPDADYKFVNWINKNDEIISTASTFDFLMPSKNEELTAVFTEKTEMADGDAGGGVTDIDGNPYKTVYIGNQEWMAENLKTRKFADGTDIPFGIDIGGQNYAASYAIFNYPVDDLTSEQIFAMYGALYNWYAVSDPKGLCPAGWRVPDDSEWNQLSAHMMGKYSLHNDMYSANPNGLGNSLKSCRQVDSPLGGECNTNEQPRWTANNTHYGTDLVNFNALPGGTISDMAHSQAQESAFWWSATPENTIQARIRYLFIETGALVNAVAGKENGLSVRCIKIQD